MHDSGKNIFPEKKERKGGRAFGGPSGGTEPEEFRQGRIRRFSFSGAGNGPMSFSPSARTRRPANPPALRP
ncbi:MAG: hypothetical protein C6W56_14610 [Caldibacillus debilis]|nr:MAG: hypothetical protein C6W56_14610 [Caldibacillus debilis]